MIEKKCTVKFLTGIALTLTGDLDEKNICSASNRSIIIRHYSNTTTATGSNIQRGYVRFLHVLEPGMEVCLFKHKKRSHADMRPVSLCNVLSEIELFSYVSSEQDKHVGQFLYD